MTRRLLACAIPVLETRDPVAPAADGSAIDDTLQAQAKADADYFNRIAGRRLTPARQGQVHNKILKACRWQYIVSGAMEPRFRKTLFGLLDASQVNRIEDALAPLAYAVPLRPGIQHPMPLRAA